MGMGGHPNTVRGRDMADVEPGENEQPASPPRMTSQTLALLAAMLSEPAAEWYGLQLAGAAGLKSGTVYPALARLERAGWLVSRWESVDPVEAGRPRRRLYSLSGLGEREANRTLEEHVKRISRAKRASGGLTLRPGEASM